MPKIKSVSTQYFAIPLAEVLTDAMHGDHSQFELITVTIALDDGSDGSGYTYTGGRGGRAIYAMIVHDLAPFIAGKDPGEMYAYDEDRLIDACARGRRAL